MNFILGLIGFAALILGFVLYFINRRYNDSGKKLLVISVIGLFLFIFTCSFTVVPTGYTGVRTTFGQVSSEVVPNGFNLKISFVQSIKLVNNKRQDVVFESQVWGESIEKTPVYASDITVTYQVSSEYGAWIFTNVTDTENLITQDIVSSAIKSAMVDLSVTDVTVRSKIEPLVKDKLSLSINEKYGDGVISIMKVTINQMDFEQSYNDAITAKSIAQ